MDFFTFSMTYFKGKELFNRKTNKVYDKWEAYHLIKDNLYHAIKNSDEVYGVRNKVGWDRGIIAPGTTWRVSHDGEGEIKSYRRVHQTEAEAIVEAKKIADLLRTFSQRPNYIRVDIWADGGWMLIREVPVR